MRHEIGAKLDTIHDHSPVGVQLQLKSGRDMQGGDGGGEHNQAAREGAEKEFSDCHCVFPHLGCSCT
jgi:hypothetical protein